MKSNSKDSNRIKEPSKLAIKFANTVFVLGFLFSILVAVYCLYRKINLPEYSATFYDYCLLFALVISILFVLGLWRLSDELKVNMSVLFITTIISVYGFEFYLQFSSEWMGPKTGIEVLEDLRDSGIDAHPNVGPSNIKKDGFDTQKGKIYPLGGISNITTILHNELGYYPIIETDEHGFNNPKGLYKVNNVDIVLAGDSFTEGYSVNSDENIGAVLREIGFNAISIGKGGSGPLIELAAIKEYAEPLKPKVVLWMYYPNDFTDLISELKRPILLKYLNEDEFTQNLMSRQEEIDSLLLNYVETLWEVERESAMRREVKYKRDRIIGLILLRNLRTKLYLRSLYHGQPDTSIFKDILHKSKQMISNWGGKMYFVYLSSFDMYSLGGDSNFEQNKKFVIKTVTELGITIIDSHTQVFALHPDPLSLFPYRMENGHYTAEGYRLIAQSIGKRLKADGIIPSN